MRRTLLIALAAACGGFLLAGMTAFGATRANIWQINGPEFRQGYVVGYLEAVTLAQRKDLRVLIPVGGGKNFDRWRGEVDAYFADPANANRTVPDAMYAVGSKIRTEWLQDWARKTQQGRPSPSPSPGP
jgi:hypothetical protein